MSCLFSRGVSSPLGSGHHRYHHIFTPLLSLSPQYSLSIYPCNHVADLSSSSFLNLSWFCPGHNQMPSAVVSILHKMDWFHNCKNVKAVLLFLKCTNLSSQYLGRHFFLFFSKPLIKLSSCFANFRVLSPGFLFLSNFA